MIVSLRLYSCRPVFFFFQAEDGIRDYKVTGVQTCALPIWPDAISAECRKAGVRHVNVDLPGKKAPSVTSDNRWGAAELTRLLLARSRPPAGAPQDAVCFLGGVRKEYEIGRAHV